MFEGYAYLVAIFVFFGTPAATSGQIEREFVTPNITREHCEQEIYLVRSCINIMNAWLTFVDYETHCLVVQEGLDCLEEVLCRCDYGNDHWMHVEGFEQLMFWSHYHNNMSQCGNDTLGESIGSTVIGALDVDRGVNCSVHNPDVGVMELLLAVAEVEIVTNVTRLCAPMNVCYLAYDRDLADTLLRKDWPEYCSVIDELLGCLVNATCECGINENGTVVELVEMERRIYSESCATITGSSVIESGIACPGSSVCEKDEPNFGCVADYELQLNNAKEFHEFCTAFYDLGSCTEKTACDCGFHKDQYYHRAITIAKHYYENITEEGETCISVMGDFPIEQDLRCDYFANLTEAEKLFVVELADAVFVEAEEASCPGIRACYDVATEQSTIAHRTKDLEAMCEAEQQLMQCLEMAYCDCGRLFQSEVANRLFRQREAYSQLCFDVIALSGSYKCRGRSTCELDDPLRRCLFEYQEGLRAAGTNIDDTCQVSKEYIVCVEEVACVCGLLQDASGKPAETVYTLMTRDVNTYENSICPAYTGGFDDLDGGIDCEGGPTGGPSDKRLVLEYAMSDEISALAEKCSAVHECFVDNDATRGDALVDRDLTRLCRVQETLINCLQKAYCYCRLDGDRAVRAYLTDQIDVHNDICEDENPVQNIAAWNCGTLKCSQANPLSGCVLEMEMDEKRHEQMTKTQQCQAYGDFVTCLDEVGCGCKILEDATSSGTYQVYSNATFALKAYKESNCSDLTGNYGDMKGGLSCSGSADTRRLKLDFADAQEVKNREADCAGVKACYSTSDTAMAQALIDRNYTKACQASQALVLCEERAFCSCKESEKQAIMDYLDARIRAHNDKCSPLSPITGRSKCEEGTGAAPKTVQAFDVMVTTFALVTSALMMA